MPELSLQLLLTAVDRMLRARSSTRGHRCRSFGRATWAAPMQPPCRALPRGAWPKYARSVSSGFPRGWQTRDGSAWALVIAGGGVAADERIGDHLSIEDFDERPSATLASRPGPTPGNYSGSGISPWVSRPVATVRCSPGPVKAYSHATHRAAPGSMCSLRDGHNVTRSGMPTATQELPVYDRSSRSLSIAASSPALTFSSLPYGASATR